MLTFWDLAQLTQSSHTWGDCVNIPRIRLLKLSILITIMARAIMNTVIIIQQQIGDVDMDMVLTMFPVVPIHFPHFVFNKLL